MGLQLDEAAVRQATGESPQEVRNALWKALWKTSGNRCGNYCGNRAKHSFLLPLYTPTTLWAAAEEVLEGVVTRKQAAIDEAIRAGMSPDELIELATIVRHTPELGGGALFDRIRSGHWPIENVPSLEEIKRRDQARRRAKAVQVREKARYAAIEHQVDPEDVRTLAVAARLLEEAGLDDQITEAEATARRQLKRAPSVRNRRQVSRSKEALYG